MRRVGPGVASGDEETCQPEGHHLGHAYDQRQEPFPGLQSNPELDLPALIQSRPEATGEEMISVLEAVRDRIRTGLESEAVAPASAPPGSAPAPGGPGR